MTLPDAGRKSCGRLAAGPRAIDNGDRKEQSPYQNDRLQFHKNSGPLEPGSIDRDYCLPGFGALWPLSFRGVFQYGDLQRGQTFGSASVPSRGTHACPQRSHRHPQICIFAMNRSVFLLRYYFKESIPHAMLPLDDDVE